MESVGKSQALDFTEHEALNEMRDYTREILKQLDAEIREGTYGAIIGDDASGRLPAILMWKVLCAVNEAAGRPRPILRFIAGSTGVRPGSSEQKEKREAVVAHIGRILNDTEAAGFSREHKALVVTDTIAKGRSLKILMGGIAKNHWNADVATMIAMDPGVIDELAEIWKCKIAANYGPAPILYTEARHLSGVTKSSFDLFSRPYQEYLDEQWLSPEQAKEETRIAQSRRTARREVDKIAQDLARDFLEKKTALK